MVTDKGARHPEGEEGKAHGPKMLVGRSPGILLNEQVALDHGPV